MKIPTLAAIAVFSAVLFSACTNNTTEQPMEDVSIKETTGADSNNMMQESMEAEDSDNKMSMGEYMIYSEMAVKDTIAAGKTPILFFHASWCSTCIAADTELSKNPEQIPENVVIFKLDYDTETELKQKYAVTTQHTFVSLDEDQNEITKWVGGDIETLVQNVE